MIYGKLSLKDWRTARVEGETPESSFESYNFRLFFFGTLYNRDQLQSSPADSNAKLVADAYLADSNYGFSRLDGSFTIVYYSKEECGIVRDHHGTHYSIYCTPEGDFASSWTYLEKQSGKPFSYDPVHWAFSSGADFCHRDLVLWPTPHFWVEESSFTCLRKTDL